MRDVLRLLQIALLMAGDFLSATPWNWLIQYPRYLVAVDRRLRKLRNGGMARYAKQYAALIADAVVSAVGQLNRPKWPDIPGQEKFRGIAFHSTEWEHEHDLTGKKVIVIGTGASAFQFAPEVAKVAADVTIFQRTPPWMAPVPTYHDDVPADKHWLLNHVPYYMKWYRFAMFWNAAEGILFAVKKDPAWNGQNHSISQENDELRQILTDWITELCDGDEELLAEERKLVGSAQWREEDAWLQHGSILVDDDQEMIAHIASDPSGQSSGQLATLRSLPGRSVRAKLSTAFLVLVTVGDHGGHLRQVGEGRDEGLGGALGQPHPECPLLLASTDECRGGAVGDHGAGVDDRQAVTQPLGLVHEVGDQHDRHPGVAHAFDQCPGVAARLRVQTGGQLVEDGDLGVADECQGDGQALLLATGEVGERGVALVLQTEQRQQLLRIGGVGVEGGVEVQRLDDAQLRG